MRYAKTGELTIKFSLPTDYNAYNVLSFFWNHWNDLSFCISTGQVNYWNAVQRLTWSSAEIW